MGHVDLLRMNLHQGAFIHSKVGDSHPGTVISTDRKIDFLIPDWCCKYLRNTHIPAVRAYIAHEEEMNLFIEGDIEQYGLETETVSLWAFIEDWDCLSLRYYSNFIISSNKDQFDVQAVADFLQDGDIQCISAKEPFLSNWLATTPLFPFKALICVVWKEILSRRSKLERNKLIVAVYLFTGNSRLDYALFTIFLCFLSRVSDDRALILCCVWSRMTAARITNPLITFCQNSDTPSITSPSLNTPITKAPMIVPPILPIPPERLVPPNTAAAIAFIS
jgi:hypothetical protein